jgi:hypothetical protein
MKPKEEKTETKHKRKEGKEKGRTIKKPIRKGGKRQ